MKITKLNIVLALLLILAGLSGSAKAESSNTVTPSIIRYGANDIDLCGKNSYDNEVIFMISIGNVERKDSLYGFQFWVSYSPSKLKFTDLLKYGTFAEKLQKVDYFIDDSTITGYAMNLDMTLAQVWGDLPLIAFKGRFAEMCPDTTTIILDNIEFTDEYKKTINGFNNLNIESKILDLPERTLGVKPDIDTVKFDTNDNSKSIRLRLNSISDNRLSNIVVSIQPDKTNNFEILDVTLSSNKFAIDSIQSNNAKYTIFLSVKSGFISEDIVDLKILRKSNLADTAAYHIKIEEINNCSCVKKYLDSYLTLISAKKDTLVGVENMDYSNQVSARYDANNEQITFVSLNTLISDIKIYDIMGVLVGSQNGINANYTAFNTDTWHNGAYFAIIKMNNTEYKKIIILN